MNSRAFALALAALILPVSNAFAQVPAEPTAKVQPVGDAVPLDPSYTKGTLPNGLTYYVRRHGEPQKGISIRVHLKSGAMMEEDDQQGWAHLVEHMLFRGTKSYPDGEGAKIWQRLGAKPGSHSNAYTSASSTRYVLDIARNDKASLDSALSVLADMMDNATMDGTLLRNEQQIVGAERAMRNTESMTKIDSDRRSFYWPGHRGGERNIIGEAKTIDAATADSIKAYYEKWYRPDLVTVVVVGDADPAMMTEAVRKAFSNWRGTGPTPPVLASYQPDAKAVPITTIVEKNLTDSVQLIWQRATPADLNLIQGRKRELLEKLAIRALDQRLSNAVQDSAKAVNADAYTQLNPYLGDMFALQLTILSGTSDVDREAEFARAARTLNSTIANLTQAEMDRQYDTELRTAERLVARQSMRSSPQLANDLVSGFDPNEVATAPEYDLALLKSAKADVTATAARSLLANIFSDEPRVLHITSRAFDGGDTALAAAVNRARTIEAAAAAKEKDVGLAAFDLPRKKGKLESRTRIEDADIDRIFLSNNVQIALKPTQYEPGQIQLRVKLGQGVVARPVNDSGLFWTVRGLGQAGYGPWSRQDLVRIGAGRQIIPRFLLTEDGLVLSTTTNRENLPDAMRVMVAAITDMKYNETAVTRLKMTFTSSYRTFLNKPSSMMDSMGTSFLFGGDKRFITIPKQAQIDAVTLPEFKKFWEGELASGPVRVSIVGDFDRASAEASAVDMFSRIKLKEPQQSDSSLLDVRARPSNEAKRNILYHIGDKGNGMLTQIFPTVSSEDDLDATRALQFAAAIVRNRLSEGFRAQQGASYMPRATTAINRSLPRYGVFTASAEMPVDKMPVFRKEVDAILADLAENGPDADSFARAREPILNEVRQLRRSNNYWTQIISDNLDNPKVVDAMRSYISGREAITPADVQRVVKQYLVGNAQSYEVVVLPLPDRYLKDAKSEDEKKADSEEAQKGSDKPGK